MKTDLQPYFQPRCFLLKKTKQNIKHEQSSFNHSEEREHTKKKGSFPLHTGCSAGFICERWTIVLSKQ